MVATTGLGLCRWNRKTRE